MFHRPALAVLSLVLAGSAAVTAAPAAPRSGFDGVWNVLIVTTSGSCDPGYRYNLRIAGNRVRYEGDGSGININVAGTVNPSGQLRVSIGRGNQQASGTGRLSGARGTGTWSGKSAGAQCSGRWEAEKRGA